MGRRATVLSIWTGEINATGLPEPLGLFLDPKNGPNKKKPPWPPCWGAALKGMLHWFILSGLAGQRLESRIKSPRSEVNLPLGHGPDSALRAM